MGAASLRQVGSVARPESMRVLLELSLHHDSDAWVSRVEGLARPDLGLARPDLAAIRAVQLRTGSSRPHRRG